MPARYIGLTSTFDQQRQVINELSEEVYNLLTESPTISVGFLTTSSVIFSQNVSFGSSVGIGTTVPQKTLHIISPDGDVKIGDITEGTPTTDAGIIFTGLGSNTSAMFTEVNGTILSYGINCEQITGIETARAGGIFRLDTRTSGPYGDSNCFVVKGRPIGSTTEYNTIAIGLTNGNTYLSPERGIALVGTAVSTGTENQKLQVTGGAYVSGSVGIGTTNPTAKIEVIGGDIKVGINTSNGLILTSPNGTKYRLIVDNSGALSTVPV